MLAPSPRQRPLSGQDLQFGATKRGKEVSWKQQHGNFAQRASQKPGAWPGRKKTGSSAHGQRASLSQGQGILRIYEGDKKPSDMGESCMCLGELEGD
jgi:hypothetical protein